MEENFVEILDIMRAYDIRGEDRDSLLECLEGIKNEVYDLRYDLSMTQD